MRELDSAERSKHYKEKKPFKKEYLYIGYALVFILLIFALLTKNKFFLFLFVTFISSIINYQTNLPTIRFNPAPEVFFSLLITRVISFKVALIMLFLPTLFVDIYTARVDKDSIFSFIITILINFILSFFTTVNFVVIGLILVTVKFIVGVVINAMIDISPQELLFEHVLGFISNILIFMSLGTFFIGIF